MVQRVKPWPRSASEGPYRTKEITLEQLDERLSEAERHVTELMSKPKRDEPEKLTALQTSVAALVCVFCAFVSLGTLTAGLVNLGEGYLAVAKICGAVCAVSVVSAVAMVVAIWRRGT